MADVHHFASVGLIIELFAKSTWRSLSELDRFFKNAFQLQNTNYFSK